MSKVSKKKLFDAWSKSVGRKIDWKLKEVKAHDGREQTQLLGENDAVVCCVNLVGDEALEALLNSVGLAFVDAPFSWFEIEGPNQANQVNKSDLSVPTPSDRPGSAVEAEKSKNADKLAEDK